MEKRDRWDKKAAKQKPVPPLNTPFANLGFKVRDGQVGIYTACAPHKILDCKVCRQHAPKVKRPEREFLSAQERGHDLDKGVGHGGTADEVHN